MRCCLVLPLLCLSCGMFSTRPSEHPSNITENSDPLHFSQLTANTQYQFTKLLYEDLFQGGDPLYWDNNSGVSTAGQLIQRLRQIATADPNVKVSWSGMIPTQTSSPDTIVLPLVTYYIEYHFLDSANRKDTVRDTGSSFFTIANGASWHISYWKDVPHGSGPSFFSPNFSH